MGKGGLRMAPEEALGEILQVGICYYSVFCPFKLIRSDVNSLITDNLLAFYLILSKLMDYISYVYKKHKTDYALLKNVVYVTLLTLILFLVARCLWDVLLHFLW